MIRRRKKVEFTLKADEARKVVLAGDFTAWTESGIQMRKDRSGLWRAGITLDPGRYEYKFLVDDQWWTDPANNQTTWNSLGAQNSVLELSAN